MNNIHTSKMSLWPLTSLVTGNLVGSGVYLLPAILAPFGVISLLGWSVTSLGAILLALVFAQLSARISKTGGPYLYAREAFGNTIGYYVAWGYWVLSWISNPALVISAVGYISILFGGFGPWIQCFLEITLFIGFALFNLYGLKVTSRFELMVTTLKVIPLLVLPLVGLFFINGSHFASSLNTEISFGTALNSAAFITLWAFIGLETGTIPAGQVQSPSKTVPRATVIGTVIASLIYILGTISIMGLIAPVDLIQSKAPYAEAARMLFGGDWAMPITLLAIISCLGTLNGWILIASRISYGAAEDEFFPEIFKKVTSQGTPYAGVLISSICTVPFLTMSLNSTLLEQFQFIVEIAVTLILIIYEISVLAYFKLVLRDKKHHTGHILLGLGALIFTSWALWAASLKMVLTSLILFALGIPMDYWMRRKRLTPLKAF